MFSLTFTFSFGLPTRTSTPRWARASSPWASPTSGGASSTHPIFNIGGFIIAVEVQQEFLKSFKEQLFFSSSVRSRRSCSSTCEERASTRLLQPGNSDVIIRRRSCEASNRNRLSKFPKVKLLVFFWSVAALRLPAIHRAGSLLIQSTLPCMLQVSTLSFFCRFRLCLCFRLLRFLCFLRLETQANPDSQTVTSDSISRLPSARPVQLGGFLRESQNSGCSQKPSSPKWDSLKEVSHSPKPTFPKVRFFKGSKKEPVPKKASNGSKFPDQKSKGVTLIGSCCRHSLALTAADEGRNKPAQQANHSQHESRASVLPGPIILFFLLSSRILYFVFVFFFDPLTNLSGRFFFCPISCRTSTISFLFFFSSFSIPLLFFFSLFISLFFRFFQTHQIHTAQVTPSHPVTQGPVPPRMESRRRSHGTTPGRVLEKAQPRR